MPRFDGRNQGGAHRSTATVGVDADREACDALPPIIRRVVKEAHSQIDCQDVLLAWQFYRAQGMLAPAFASLVADAIVQARRADCRLTYGPTHPDVLR